MKRSISKLSTALLLLSLSACSESPDNTEAAVTFTAPVKRTAFKNLERFNGMPPWDLVKDDVIGKEIRAIVPRSEFKCLDDTFNYMRDLEIQKDGSVSASMNGSHADHFREASVTVTPAGVVTIALQCVFDFKAPKKYQIFTNENIRTIKPSAVDGIYDAVRGDVVVISDGKEKVEMAFEDFEQPTSPANNSQDVVTPAVQSKDITERRSEPGQTPNTELIAMLMSQETGIWKCESTKKSFLPPSVSAIFNGHFESIVGFGDEREGMNFKYSDGRNVTIVGPYSVNGSTVNVMMGEGSLMLINGEFTPAKPKIRLSRVAFKEGKLRFIMEVEGTYATTNTCGSPFTPLTTKDIMG